jgi:hypothetical protein
MLLAYLLRPRKQQLARHGACRCLTLGPMLAVYADLPRAFVANRGQLALVSA